MSYKKYLVAFKNSWQTSLEYRLDTALHFFIALISLVSVFFLWETIFASKASLAGYDKAQIITYYIIVAYIFSTIYASLKVSDEIQQGQLSQFIVKPVSYIFYTYTISLARRLFRMLLGLPVIILIFIIFHDKLFIVTNPINYLYLLLGCFSAINILFLIDLILGFLEFWILHSDGLNLLTNVITGFLSGTILPLIFFPQYIQTISTYLPFQYTGFFVIEAFLGKQTGINLLQGFAIQLFWTIALIILAKIMWSRGLKRYEAFGS